MAKKFKMETWHWIVLVLVSVFVIMRGPTFFGAVYTPSRTQFVVQDIENMVVSGSFTDKQTDNAGTVDISLLTKPSGQANTFLYDYSYPAKTYTNKDKSSSPQHLRVSYSYSQITFENGIIDITYDGGNSLKIYLPVISAGSSGFGVLYVADDGSTYIDSGMTSLAMGAPGPGEEPTCQESWLCADWNSCDFFTNQQVRICVDVNACGTIVDRPAEVQPCIPENPGCVEDWVCGSCGGPPASCDAEMGGLNQFDCEQLLCSWNDWSVCVDGQQIRECTDLNNCGTTVNMPSEAQSCGQVPSGCSNPTADEEQYYCDFSSDLVRKCVDGNWAAYVACANQCGVEGVSDSSLLCQANTDCNDGETRVCGTSTGMCEFGQEVCIAGEWSSCSGGIGPVPEVCDSLDNDCDGAIDDGNICAECTNGATQQCGISGSGECSFGTQTCIVGEWGDCVGDVNPVPEICDGLDNDCDGAIDENVMETCINYASCTSFTTCDVCPSTPDEVCNNIDDNCNDIVDEGVTTSCIDYDTCQLINICGSCDQAPVEVCDGEDNNCDGTVDEGCACTDGATQSCGVSDIGECGLGTQTCSGGQWGLCMGDVGPVGEVCDDSLDNDCDGIVDEECAVSCQTDSDCADNDSGNIGTCVDNQCQYADIDAKDFFEKYKQPLLIGGGVLGVVILMRVLFP